MAELCPETEVVKLRVFSIFKDLRSALEEFQTAVIVLSGQQFLNSGYYLCLRRISQLTHALII